MSFIGDHVLAELQDQLLAHYLGALEREVTFIS